MRAVVAIVTGALLIKYREETVQWLTIAVGVLFFISGVISCAVWYSAKRKADREALPAETRIMLPVPFIGLGSVILGIILAVLPTTFLTWFMYILAAILILGAVNQYVNLGMALRWCRIGWFYWLPPTAILLVSIYVIVYPMEALSLPLFIIGWTMMVYGVAECVNALMLHRARRQYENSQAEQEVQQVVTLDSEEE